MDKTFYEYYIDKCYSYGKILFLSILVITPCKHPSFTPSCDIKLEQVSIYTCIIMYIHVVTPPFHVFSTYDVSCTGGLEYNLTEGDILSVFSQ